MSELFIKDKYGYDLNPAKAEEKFNIPIIMQVSLQDLEDILVTAFESDAMNCWAVLDNDRPEWDSQPEDMPLAQYALEILLKGESIKFYDVEGSDDDKDWFLDLNKLLEGIAKNMKERPHDCDLENMDSITADCIIQYALFGEVIYG